MPTITLYGKPGCHLCDDARAELERLRAELGFELEQVDVTPIPGCTAATASASPWWRSTARSCPTTSSTLAGCASGSRRRPSVSGGAGASPRIQYSWRVSFRDPMTGGAGLQEASSERLSLGVAARLSRYLQVLTQAKKMGRETISSQELADYTHVNSTQIRRDLSGFGKFGKRGVGYNVDSLVSQIRKILRTTGKHNIALFGAGNLGQAIAGSDIFADHGFRVVALFDKDPGKVGTSIGDSLEVRPYDDLERVVRDEDVVVGVLAVPTEAAQEVADDLVEAGVKIIFNYSEALLQVPPEVTVHTSSPAVDLLYALYFYLT